MTVSEPYTTQLKAGLGLVHETRVLLDMWSPNIDAQDLLKTSLASGRFPEVSARRLRNIIVECFAPRYMSENGRPAILLKAVSDSLQRTEFDQLLFVYTCRANRVLRDFVTDVFWPKYSAGHHHLRNEDALDFVLRASQDGKTSTPWSESSVHRVASSLTGCCADFGLLERGRKSKRKILPFRLLPRPACLLSYEFHFCGLGDNAIVSHPDWLLFGMERMDIVDLFKRLSLMGLIIVQTAGDLVRVTWKFKNLEELKHVIAED